MVALKLNKLIIPMCSITLLIISCVSLSNNNSLLTILVLIRLAKRTHYIQ